MNGWDGENLWEVGLSARVLPEGFPHHRFLQLGLACLARSLGTWFHLGHHFEWATGVRVNCLVVLVVEVQLLLFPVVHLQLCACEPVAVVVLGAEIHPETVSAVVVLGAEIHLPARWMWKRVSMDPLEGQRDVPKGWWSQALRWAHLACVRQQCQVWA